MAVLCQMLERRGHVAQGFCLTLQFLYVLQRNALDVGAGAAAVLPQGQQFVHLLH
ncbi:hypothetical protein D3C80_2137770 [compost metagenome]